MTEAYERLENEFGDFVNMRQGEMVACSSGTSALHLAFEALELKPYSEVIMSDYNMIACPRAVTLAGLVPKFIDCNSDDLLMTDTRPLRNRNSSAILAVHIYGRQVDMKRRHIEAEPRGLAIIEDMAEIHGIPPHPESDAACWSFYKNKIVAGEEGGMVWFRDPARAKIARELRSLGFTDKHDYLHRPRGHNYRLSNCHAELILKSLMRFSENNARRNWIEDLYDKYIPKQWHQPLRDAVWVYDLRIPDLGYQRLDFIIRELNQQGIAARHGFKPMSSQLEYRTYDSYHTPNTGKAAMEVLYLPVYPSMRENEVKANSEALVKAYQVSFATMPLYD